MIFHECIHYVSKKPHAARAWLLTACLVFASAADAAPVTYTLVFATNPGGANPTGSLGSVTFGNTADWVRITLTFQGDTQNVTPWSIGGTAHTQGYEIRTGAASVEIDGPNGVLAQGTFDPAAGIFVSIDNTNEGIGFGSHAVWPPTDPNFPGEPAYPFGDWIFSGGGVGLTADPSTYDLKSNFDSGLNSGWSCVGFPANWPNNCGMLALPTSAGNFSLNPLPYLDTVYSYFHTVVQSMIAFDAFSARAQISDGRLDIFGNFKLGASSSGINPLTETVTLGIGTNSVTLPPGSFQSKGANEYSYRGVVNGAALRVGLTGKPSNSWGLSIVESGYKNSAAGKPLALSLMIGSDEGSTSLTPTVDD